MDNRHGRYSPELAAAQEAAVAAGQAIKALYGTRLDVGQKSHDNPVTVADLQSNEIIRDRIRRDFADDGWLSEETEDRDDRLGWNRVWVVDPLDGTKEFISHIAEFCVSIALVEEGRARLGVLYNPITDELFAGAEGGTVLLNGKPSPIGRQRDLAQASVLASRSETNRGEWDRFKGRFKMKETGSVAYKLGLVAAGRADATFSLTPKHEWDVCAGAALVEIAGGRMTDSDGKPLIYNKRIPPLLPGLVASNVDLHRQLMGLIGTTGKS